MSEASGLPWHRVREALTRLDHEPAPEAEKTGGRLALPEGIGPLGHAHREYLKARKLDPDHLEKFWGLQGIGIAARLQWRIFIPIAFRGRTVSWTTRSIAAKAGRRYVNAPAGQEAMPAKELLFGADHARHCIIVCEGPFDAMRIGPGAVATMGTAYSAAQLSKMAAYPLRVVCMDSDPNAQKRAKRLCQALACFAGRTYNILLDSKDPGEASEKELKRLRRFLE